MRIGGRFAEEAPVAEGLAVEGQPAGEGAAATEGGLVVVGRLRTGELRTGELRDKHLLREEVVVCCV